MAETSNTESQRRRREAAYRRGFEDGRASTLHGEAEPDGRAASPAIALLIAAHKALEARDG